MKPGCAVIVAMEHVQVHRHFMNNHPANRPEQVRQALVLSGGGARAAYQVGCLRHIAQAIPEYRPKILTGVSAGAINAVHLPPIAAIG